MDKLWSPFKNAARHLNFVSSQQSEQDTKSSNVTHDNFADRNIKSFRTEIWHDRVHAFPKQFDYLKHVYELSPGDDCPVRILDYNKLPLTSNHDGKKSFFPGYIRRSQSELTFTFSQGTETWELADTDKEIMHTFDSRCAVKKGWLSMVFPPDYEEDNVLSSSEGINFSVSSKATNNTAIANDRMTQDSDPYVDFTSCHHDNSSNAPSNDEAEGLTCNSPTMINTVDQKNNENATDPIANGTKAIAAADIPSTYNNSNAATDASASKHMTQETLKVFDFNLCDKNCSAQMVSVAAKSIVHDGKEYTLRKSNMDEAFFISFPNIVLGDNNVFLGPMKYNPRRTIHSDKRKKVADPWLRHHGLSWRKISTIKYQCSRYQHPLLEGCWLTQHQSKLMVSALNASFPSQFANKSCPAYFKIGVENNSSSPTISFHHEHLCDIHDHVPRADNISNSNVDLQIHDSQRPAALENNSPDEAFKKGSNHEITRLRTFQGVPSFAHIRPEAGHPLFDHVGFRNFHDELLKNSFIEWNSGDLTQQFISSTAPTIVQLEECHSFLSWHIATVLLMHPGNDSITMSIRKEILCETNQDIYSDQEQEHMHICTETISAIIPFQSVKMIYSLSSNPALQSSVVQQYEMLIAPPQSSIHICSKVVSNSLSGNYVIHLMFNNPAAPVCLNTDRQTSVLANAGYNDNVVFREPTQCVAPKVAEHGENQVRLNIP